MIERTLCGVLVGREAELATLEDALIDAAQGDGKFVAISGEAGIGKSRLATAARQRALRLGYVVAWGGCAAMDLAVPYLPFLEAIGKELSRADLREVTERLGSLASDLAALFPQLHPEPVLAGRREPDKGRLFEAMIILLGALARESPLLLIIEDLHWADPASRELVEYLARRVSSLPLLIVVTYRSDELSRGHPLMPMIRGWRQGQLATTLELSPLTPGECAAMAAEIFKDETSDEFRDYLFEQSEGSPFALEEFLKEAIDSGDIFLTDHGWNRKAIDQLPLPRAVADVILTRVERLDDEVVGVLQSAAVLGRSFAYDVLTAATGLPVHTVRTSVETAVSAQLLEPDPAMRAGFRFRHALTRSAVYEAILSPTREALHLGTALALRSAGAPAAEIAHHLLSAGQEAEALPECMRAAEDAMAALAWPTAAAFYEKVLAQTTGGAERSRLLLRLGEVQFNSGQLKAAEQSLGEAIQLLEEAGEAALVAQARVWLATSQAAQSRLDDAGMQLARALEDLAPLGPSEELAMVYVRLATRRFNELDFAGVQAMAEEAIAACQGEPVSSARTEAMAYLGTAEVWSGRMEEGFSTLESSRREAAARGDYRTLSHVLNYDTWLRACFGVGTHGFGPLIAEWRQVPGLTQHAELGRRILESVFAFEAGRLFECKTIIRDMRALAARLGSAAADDVLSYDAAIDLARDDLPGARAKLPPLNESLPMSTFVDLAPLWIALELAAAQPARAAAIATEALRVTAPRTVARLSDAAIEAHLAHGSRAAARSLLDEEGQFHGPARFRHLERARARVALADGDDETAVRCSERALSMFAEEALLYEELRTRVLVAASHGASGHVQQATTTLAALVEAATSAGFLLIVREARELSDQLGIVLPGEVYQTRQGGPDGIVAADDTPDLVALAIRSGADVAGSAARPADHAALRDWIHRRVASRGGTVQTSDEQLTMAVFGVGYGDADPYTTALEIGLATRGKARLLGLPVSVVVAPTSAEHNRSPSAPADEVEFISRLARGHFRLNHLMLTEEAYQHLAGWLQSRGFVVDRVALDTTTGAMPVSLIRVLARGVPAREIMGTPHTTVTPVTQQPPNVFRLEGEFWTLRYAGVTVRLKHTKGLQDIARLLSTPGAEVPTVDLVGVATPMAKGAIQRVEPGALHLEAGVEMLDNQARAEYRTRLRELEEEVGDADADNDPERASRAREEREFLLTELSAAVGIGGRSRRALDPAERARKAVQWRIRDAIKD